MKAWKRLGAAGMAVLATACASTPQTRLTTALSGSDFNSLVSRYSDRPTYVTVEGKEGAQVLRIEMVPYDTYDPVLKMNHNSYLPFEQKFVDDYLPLIDKYAEWEQLAVSRGDAFDKEIGRARTVSALGSGSAELRFTFHSGNADEQFLAVSQCTATCLNPIQFDKVNVGVLRRLLVDLKAGAIRQLDVNSVYH